jgi:hypothetical protein
LDVNVANPVGEKDLLAREGHDGKVGTGAHGVPECKVETVAKVATIIIIIGVVVVVVVGNLVPPRGRESDERVPWP